MYDILIELSYGTYILICFNRLDEGFKSSSYLTEILLDPELGHAYESNKTAFNKAHSVKENMWTWFERPENRLRLARLGAGMNGVKNASHANSILEGSVTLSSSIARYLYQCPTFAIEFCRVWMGASP